KDPGHEPIRRLTHTEYGRTVRDLFGVEVDVAGKFPIDLSGTSGFDNSANTLFLQGPLLERYIHVADHVVEQALPESAESAGQKRSRELVFVSRPTGETSSEEAARAILERFLLRAYRRPATRSEVDAFMDQFRRARQSGEEFESAVKRTLKVVLISPNFLLRIEAGRETDEAYRVGEWELASRLSYFLWASMPDDELFELARRKRLRDPAVLRRQVRRMLAEPRAKTLGSVFAAQWLGFEHVGTRVRLDPIDNPWCTDTLMHAMKEESALFFLSLVQENSPISRLVDADYTYLNEELARHYEIDGVRGARLRRVALDNPNRGGIFGQASLLAVTSFPHRTSPVVRGKWILADVLGTPPPPPPPDAGEFSEEVREKRRLTLREKLEIHRENPRCNACHQEIDPLGFSLENFGRFGRWRTSIRGRPIDAKGRLPDGTEFEGPVGLKKIIVERRMPDLVRQISRKMLSYALGRQLEYYDEPAVRKIVRTLEENDYRFGTLIDEVVTSYPFQFKKNRKKNRKKDRKKDREKSGSPGKVKRF
ncbi:MAG: DUF1592 domain-containing protein, partial [Planctomycetota bacterium]|nr:DUF1592 domain-containing protein [Planctomycetota bacterium]